MPEKEFLDFIKTSNNQRFITNSSFETLQNLNKNSLSIMKNRIRQ